MDEIDYLIVGKGLAGSLLAYNLFKEGAKIRIIDANEEVTSSKIAAGIYNPITGRRMVKTWMADSLFPFLEPYYAEIETFLGIEFLHKKPVFRPFDSIADQNYWFGQSSDEAFKNYIRLVDNETGILKKFHSPFGGFYTDSSGYIQVGLMLKGFEKFFFSAGILQHETFNHEEVVVNDGGVQYREISTKAIIFCEGVKNKTNLFFHYLPMMPTKGEILDVIIEDYDITSIVNKRIFVLPETNFQRVGSTYDRDFTDLYPSISAKEELAAKLNAIIKTSYKIINQRAAARPTVLDRKPMLGKHPKLANTFIFNGLGTKGVSLAPYFSVEMSNYLQRHKPFLPEVDIQRFDYLYH